MPSVFRLTLIATLLVASYLFLQDVLRHRHQMEQPAGTPMTLQLQERHVPPRSLHATTDGFPLEGLAQTPVAFYRVLGDAVSNGRLFMEQAKKLIVVAQIAPKLLGETERQSGRRYLAHHYGAADCALRYVDVTNSTTQEDLFDVVVASLLHAVANRGTIGTLIDSGNVTLCEGQARLARVFGSQVASILVQDAYFPLTRFVEAAILIYKNLLERGRLTSLQQHALFVKLCDEYEEHSDFEQGYGNNRKRTELFKRESVALLARLGQTRLSEALARSFRFTERFYQTDNSRTDPFETHQQIASTLKQIRNRQPQSEHYNPPEIEALPYSIPSLFEKGIKLKQTDAVVNYFLSQDVEMVSAFFNMCDGYSSPAGSLLASLSASLTPFHWDFLNPKLLLQLFGINPDSSDAVAHKRPP